MAEKVKEEERRGEEDNDWLTWVTEDDYDEIDEEDKSEVRGQEENEVKGRLTSPPAPVKSNASVDPPKASRFAALVKASKDLIANTYGQIQMSRKDKNQESCGIRGCRWYIWIHAILLVLIGLWLLWFWADIAFVITEKKYLAREVAPKWPILSNVYCFAACWVQPFLSAIWLIIATLSCKRHFIRIYFLVTPWLLFIPLAYAIFYIFYMGNINEVKIQGVLRKHLDEYRPDQDASIWDSIQNKFQCCGINDHGWMDWMDSGNILGHKSVPMSCCIKKTGEACSISPSNENTHAKGCLMSIITDYYAYGTQIVFALFISIILSMFSIFAATRFYIFVTREVNDTFEFSGGRYFKECLCPCFICCMKSPLDQVRPDPMRTTEMMYRQRVEKFGTAGVPKRPKRHSRPKKLSLKRTSQPPVPVHHHHHHHPINNNPRTLI